MGAFNLGDIIVKLKADTADLERGYKSAESRTQRFSDKMEKLADTAKNVVKRVTQVGTALFAVGAVLGIKTNAELETANLQFETLMGSAEKAQKHVKSLFDFAKKTPFETQPIIDASLKLQTFGGAALNTQKNLKLVGDAAAATNAGIEEVAFWVGRAYAMIQSGKPFGEAAMRLQELAVLSPQARDEMEKLQASGASAEVVFGALQKELGKFNGAMEKQATTLKGLWSTFMDVIKLDLGYIFEPLFQSTKKALSAVIKFADSPAWAKIKQRARDSIQKVADALDRIIEAFESGGFKKAMQQAGKEFSGFSKSVVESLEKIDWSKILQKVIESFLSILEKIDFSKYANVFSNIFLDILNATDWISTTARAIPILVKVFNDIFVGVFLGILNWAKQDPMGFMLTLISILFLPAKAVSAISVALTKIPLVGTIFAWLLRAVNGLGEPVRALFSGIGLKITEGIKGGAAGLLVALWEIFKKIIAFFIPSTNWLGPYGRGIVTGLINGFRGMFGALWSAMGAALSTIQRFFGGAGGWLYGTGRAMIQGLINGARSMAGSLWNGIAEVSANIGRFFSGAGGWLYHAGRAIVDGLIAGIKSMGGKIVDAAKWVGETVKNNKGPIEKDRKMLIPEGRAIMIGLNRGLVDGISDIKRTLMAVTRDIPSMAASGASAAPTVNNSRSFDIHGPMNFYNNTEIDYLVDKLNRNSELESMAISPRGGSR